MATLTLHIRPCRAGRYTLYIRVCHNRVSKYIKYPVMAMPGDIEDGQIVNMRLASAVYKEIHRMADVLADQGIRVAMWDAAQICDFLIHESRDEQQFKLDFLEYYQECMGKMIREGGKQSTVKNYGTSLNNLVKYCNEILGIKTLDINDIDGHMMQTYVNWLVENNYGKRAIQSYITSHKAIFNRAVKEYNEDDFTAIKKRPFSRLEIPKYKPSAKRALEPFVIRMIDDVNLEGESEMVQMARDSFMMSFMLCGMNGADMYEQQMITNGKIIYDRQKTRDRNEEASHMELDYPEELRPYDERHFYGKDKKHQWNFWAKYLNSQAYNASVNSGLKKMADIIGDNYARANGMTKQEAMKELCIDRLQFYAARHSWATIAANDCNVPISIVDKSLAHAGTTLAEKSYIKKDFVPINKANRAVLDYVFHSEEAENETIIE